MISLMKYFQELLAKLQRFIKQQDPDSAPEALDTMQKMIGYLTSHPMSKAKGRGCVIM